MANQNQFESRIRQFSAVRRRLHNGTFALRLGTLALVALILGLLVLSGWLPGAFVNLALFAALAIFLIALAARFVIRRSKFKSVLDEAFIMEALAGGLNSRLISAWDFVHHTTISPFASFVI